MPKLTAGKSIVTLLVVLGVALAGANVWHRYATTDRIHRRWGAETMELIARAPQAEWLKLAAARSAERGEAGRTDGQQTGSAGSLLKDAALEIDGSEYFIVERGDLISARGFSNLRHALGQNGSYNWADDLGPSESWRWAIVFADADRHVTLLVDEDAQWLKPLNATGLTSTVPVEATAQMSAGLKKFFAEQTPAP